MGDKFYLKGAFTDLRKFADLIHFTLDQSEPSAHSTPIEPPAPAVSKNKRNRRRRASLTEAFIQPDALVAAETALIGQGGADVKEVHEELARPVACSRVEVLKAPVVIKYSADKLMSLRFEVRSTQMPAVIIDEIKLSSSAPSTPAKSCSTKLSTSSTKRNARSATRVVGKKCRLSSKKATPVNHKSKMQKTQRTAISFSELVNVYEAEVSPKKLMNLQFVDDRTHSTDSKSSPKADSVSHSQRSASCRKLCFDAPAFVPTAEPVTESVKRTWLSKQMIERKILDNRKKRERKKRNKVVAMQQRFRILALQDAAGRLKHIVAR
jgi:hypothetical protein